MKNRTRLMSVLALVAIAVTVRISAAEPARGDVTEAKIRLLSAALQARDSGDLAASRQYLQELLKMSPGDQTVQRLLAGLDKMSPKTVTVTGAESTGNDATEAEQMVKAEEQRLTKLIAAAHEAVREARELAERRQFDAAFAKLDKARVALPKNVLTENVGREIELARNDIHKLREKSTAAISGQNQTPSSGLIQSRREATAEMLTEVDRAWQRPDEKLSRGEAAVNPPDATAPLREKLERIRVPAVNFSAMELARVVHTLGAIAREFDAASEGPKGVNVMVADPAGANPPVNLSLHDVSLKRLLDMVAENIGYRYELQSDAVIFRPRGGAASLDTQFFPVSRHAVLRMTGRAGPSPAGKTEGTASVSDEGQAIRSFLQLAGVNFENESGSSLAFDGSQLIVTQTPLNLVRVRNILERYQQVRQVEIEAKFMEVQDGALEEVGVNWNIGKKATQHSGASVSDYQTSNRSLDGAFRNATSNQQIEITGQSPIPVNPPSLPGGVNVGVNANPLASITGIVGEFNVNAVVRALSQKSGTELLSAPKLTVLSGNQATITVAQELRYPQSYGQVQSQVGTGNSSGGGSAGVAITAGTPQEFTTRNVGVELKVAPTVEEDDRSISMDLNPKVTEFEGFVEYGGTSIAISQGTSVTVPSGFYQPIFAVREVSTRVTLWDGATLIMGGLTREDTRRTNDKVPLIGNLPVLGRLFRSRGDSTQKRNLLIFVTANLVTPGGTLKQPRVAEAGAR